MVARVVRLGSVIVFSAVVGSAAAAQPITCESALSAQDPLTAYVERAADCLRPVGELFARNTDQALADANFVIAQDPTFAAAYAVRGQAHLWAVQPAQAVRDLSIALFLDPTNVDWLLFRSELMVFLNDIDGAIADLTSAIAVEPANEALLLERSRLHERRADLTSALADAEQAAALNPESAAALLRIADVHYEAGRDQVALDAYRAYLAVTTERSPVVNARILILEQRLGSGG